MNRLIGIITFKPPVYREVAHDPAALTPAAIVVVVVTIVTALLSSARLGLTRWGWQPLLPPPSPLS